MSIAVNRPVSLLVYGLASIAIFSVLFSWARAGQKNRGVKEQSKWKVGWGRKWTPFFFFCPFLHSLSFCSFTPHALKHLLHVHLSSLAKIIWKWLLSRLFVGWWRFLSVSSFHKIVKMLHFAEWLTILVSNVPLLVGGWVSNWHQPSRCIWTQDGCPYR